MKINQNNTDNNFYKAKREVRIVISDIKKRIEETSKSPIKLHKEVPEFRNNSQMQNNVSGKQNK
ncbi:MAG: hypothetical protein LH629_05920 [Ignavibacteria bacterium]|nr:hypothetical protein [Ignavibacteria bacterium]